MWSSTFKKELADSISQRRFAEEDHPFRLQEGQFLSRSPNLA